MMDELMWIKQKSQKAKEMSPKYEERAFYHGLELSIDELAKRIDQKQAELDGRIWNHEKW